MIFILDRINVNGEEALIGGLGHPWGAIRGKDGIQHGGARAGRGQGTAGESHGCGSVQDERRGAVSGGAGDLGCAGSGRTSASGQETSSLSGRGRGRYWYRWRYLLRFGRIELRLRLLLELLLLLFCHVMADGATDHGTGDRVMASNVARHGADCRAFDTAFCCCGLRADSQGEGE